MTTFPIRPYAREPLPYTQWAATRPLEHSVYVRRIEKVPPGTPPIKHPRVPIFQGCDSEARALVALHHRLVLMRREGFTIDRPDRERQPHRYDIFRLESDGTWTMFEVWMESRRA